MTRLRVRDEIGLVSVRLAPEDLATLDDVAAHDRKSRSEIMRQVLPAHLHKRRITRSMGAPVTPPDRFEYRPQHLGER